MDSPGACLTLAISCNNISTLQQTHLKKALWQGLLKWNQFYLHSEKETGSELISWSTLKVITTKALSIFKIFYPALHPVVYTCPLSWLPWSVTSACSVTDELVGWPMNKLLFITPRSIITVCYPACDGLFKLGDDRPTLCGQLWQCCAPLTADLFVFSLSVCQIILAPTLSIAKWRGEERRIQILSQLLLKTIGSPQDNEYNFIWEWRIGPQGEMLK